VTSLVHWYNLKRISPKDDPAQRDSWSLPGETSSEAALAYFVMDARFPHRLQICNDDDLSVEFVLEKRTVLRMQFGTSQRLRAGEVVGTYFVKGA
jgi:hypothetical protein